MQMAYAKRILAGGKITKGEIARSVGYSESASKSCATHIENKVGFHAAMAKLANESNNAALKAIHEFNARNMNSFSNKELISAISAISNAWEKFNKVDKPLDEKPLKENRLRAVVIKHASRVIDIKEPKEPEHSTEVEQVEEVKDEDPNDF